MDPGSRKTPARPFLSPDAAGKATRLWVGSREPGSGEAWLAYKAQNPSAADLGEMFTQVCGG